MRIHSLIRPRLEWGAVLFAVLVIGIVVAITVTCAVEAAGWADRIYPGFLAYRNGILCLLNQPHWSGPRSGASYPDRVVAVDGEAVSGFDEVLERIGRLPEGTSVRYTLVRGSSRREIEVPVARFSALDVLLTFGVLSATGVACFALGLLVFLLRPSSVATGTFFFFGALLGLWGVCKFDYGTNHRFSTVMFLANSLLPVAGMHLALNFPVARPAMRRSLTLHFLLYLPAAALFGGFVYGSHGHPEIFLLAENSVFAAGVFSVLVVAVSWLTAYRQAESPTTRLRAKFLLIGTGVVSLPAIPAFVLAGFGWVVPFNLLAVVLLGYVGIFAYSILKQNIFDIDLVLHRTFTYAAILFVVTAAYLALATVASEIGRVAGFEQAPYTNLVFLIFLILIFQPLKTWVKQVLDRQYFRGRYEFQKVIQGLNEKLASLHGYRQTLAEILGTIRATLDVKRADVVILEPGENRYRWYSLSGRGALEEHQAKMTDERGRILRALRAQSASGFSTQPGGSLPDTASREALHSDWAPDLGVAGVVPLEGRGGIVGYLLLGKKHAKAFYTSEDLDLLKIIADQIAISLENARLYTQREELAQDLHEYATESVYALKLQVELLEMLLGQDARRARRKANELHRNTERVIQSLRDYIEKIREPQAVDPCSTFTSSSGEL